MSTTEGEKIIKKEIIELPDMESGVCSCEHVVHGQKVRPVDIHRTWGYYCTCQFDPKRGKERKLSVELIGLWKKNT